MSGQQGQTREGLSLRRTRLPKVIWSQIVSYFTQDDDVCISNWRQKEEHIRDIRNLRLVCKAIKSLVDPNFLPVLRLSLDYDSMDRMEQISKHRTISKSVRAISLDLSVYPATIANDIQQYHRHIEQFVNAQCEECDWHSECRFYDEGDMSSAAVEWRTWRAAEEQYHQIRYSWQMYMDSEVDGISTGQQQGNGPSTIDETYRDLLPDCYEKYHQLHLDQQEIITNSSFIYTLTETISRLPNATSLRIHDTSKKLRHPTRELCYNPTLLSEVLLRPSPWSTIQETSLPHPAQLLLDLPLALPNLTSLRIECFPSLAHLPHLLTPTTPDPKFGARLSTSLQNLTRFHFSPSPPRRGPRTEGPLSPAHGPSIDGYLRAMLSSKRLEHVHLDLEAFATHVAGTQAQSRRYDVTAALSEVRAAEDELVLEIRHGRVDRRELERYQRQRRGRDTSGTGREERTQRQWCGRDG